MGWDEGFTILSRQEADAWLSQGPDHGGGRATTIIAGIYFLGRAYNYGLLFSSTPVDMIKIPLELLSVMFACPNDYNQMWVGKDNKM